MNNKEAIRRIRSHMIFHDLENKGFYITEALKMAIEALKVSEIPTGSDLISRQTIIDAIEETDWYHLNRNGEMVHGSSSEYESWYKYDDIFKAIKSIPSAEPNLQPTCNRLATTEGDLISREAVLSLFPNGFYSGLASQIKSLPSATCDDCIWHTCNYNKVDWDGEDGYISRRDAIKNAHFPMIDDAGYEVVRVDDILALPSAEPKTGTLTEEVREALMRLTMCAREECKVCKYEDDCGFDAQYQRATENMIIISNALKEPKTGHWIRCKEQDEADLDNGNALYECSNCGHTDLHAETQEVPYCWFCGSDMRGDKNG